MIELLPLGMLATFAAIATYVTLVAREASAMRRDKERNDEMAAALKTMKVHAELLAQLGTVNTAHKPVEYVKDSSDERIAKAV